MEAPLKLRPVKFAEAMALALKRNVVLPDEYYGVLQGIERAEAFSVAQMAKLDQLQQVLDSLNTAMDKGMTFDRWKDEILKAPDALALPRHRLDNIFRTNIQGAYARGRCVHIAKNKHRRPWLMYSAINDSRVRPHHLAMDGMVAEVGASVWKVWMPPAGYRCRCTVLSLTEEQAKARRAADEKRLQGNPEANDARAAALKQGPDEGWDYSPCERMGQDAIDTINKKMDGYHAALKAKADAAAKQAAIIAAADDPDKWKKIGGQQGSNAGGQYQGADGRKYYVKSYKDPDQARSEVAAHKINALVGLDAPEAKIVVQGGKPVIASGWIDDATPATVNTMTKTAAMRRQLARIYVSAALTKNWDVVGQTLDNIVLTKGGKLVVIDAGGAFKYRAQGGPKVFKGGPVDEMDSLLNAGINPQAAKVFAGLSDKEIAAAINVLDTITKKQIREVFETSGFALHEIEALTEATWARRKWMLEVAKNKAAAAKAAKAAPGASPTPGVARVFDRPAPLAYDVAVAAQKQYPTQWDDSKQQVKWRAKSDAETVYFAAANIYSKSYYKAINKSLRAGAAGQAQKIFAEGITEALRLLPKYSGMVQRGVWTHDIPNPEAWIKAHVDARVAGKPIEYQGFVSTSYGSGFSGDIKVYIEAKGIQGASISEISNSRHEKEVLFPHKSRFEVRKVIDNRKTGGGVEIYLIETQEATVATDGFKAAMPDIT